MYSVNRSSRKPSHKVAIISIIVVVLLLAGGAFYHFHNASSPKPTTSTGSTINYGPPTDAQKSDAQRHKDQLANNAQNNNSQTGVGTDQGSTSPASKRQVTPLISSWGKNPDDTQNFYVNGFVPNLVEDGGTCTLTMTKNGQTVTQTKAAVINATNTSCGEIAVPYASLGKGTTWQANLRYSSATAEGTSATTSVEVN